ncbi:MAG: hypothetical protein K2I06_08235 [Ruminococcus sp.]|nr:hypothetical protein [Ruminococcus sp.]
MDDNYYLDFPFYQFLDAIYSGINQIQRINPYFINNNPKLLYAVRDIYNGLNQIESGLAVEYASTGMPIYKLNRWARILAQLKNIGSGNAWNGISIVVSTFSKIKEIEGYINGYLNGYNFGLSY